MKVRWLRPRTGRGMTAAHASRVLEYFDQYFGSNGRIKHKTKRPVQVLTPRADQFAKFGRVRIFV